MNHVSFGTLAGNAVPQHIALIGNSLPRRCGIATFTGHCRDALQLSFPAMRIDSYAMDDGAGALYPADVQLIAQNDILAYADAARRIEESGAQAIWLQHEFGIFGGSAGDMILHLLDRTQLPLVLTLHTILDRPNTDEARVMDALLKRAGRIMVMAERGRDILLECYGVDEARIAVIPHGVPDRPLVEPDTMKAPFGWAGRCVILTFGLLAPDKGIEHVIRAMPAVAARHPDALYVVLGATHPNLVREQGETLRTGLMALAQELGVGEHVRFIDQFVEQEQLIDYLQAADIYVTPYLNPAQITSGTLSYAVGMGKPVISTPYVQAQEILADDRGVLVPFRDSAAMAAAIDRLLSDRAVLGGYATRAYGYGRRMIWSELARRVGDLLGVAVATQPTRFIPRRSYATLSPDAVAILRMSDATGMLQHSILSIPDRNHGYCIDDNARALILMTQMPEMADDLRDQWITTYASFIQHGWNPDRGRFRNFMSFDRRWLEEEGAEDSNGRALWALGVTRRDAHARRHREWAAHLFNIALPPLSTMTSPRAQAFIILACGAMLEAEPDHALANETLARCADHLAALLTDARRPYWAWFESVLAYDNARLPQALLIAGRHLQRQDLVDLGLQTLAWIAEKQRAPEGHFRAIGTESFGRPHQSPLPFDQQPLEAQATIDAAIAALAVDPDPAWLALAQSAYRWFLGDNDLDTPLATPANSGCYDGLTPIGPNRNQGAESLLALQLASCAMNRLSRTMPAVAEGRDADAPVLSA